MKFLSHRYFTLTVAALSMLCLAAPISLQAKINGIEHVIIIGCDGMSTGGVIDAETPVMDRMMAEGSWTMHARAVMPTVSSPNWASMIMGAGPEQHGVTSNEWMPFFHPIKPTFKGKGNIFPTIFGILREQRPDAVIACFHDWKAFGRLIEPGVPTILERTDGPVVTVDRGIQYFNESKPAFMFLHLDNVDHVGHGIGWGTPEYNQEVTKADTQIGRVLAAVESSDAKDKTIILVTADHGGIAKGHGGITMVELEIPWIIWGPGIIRGHEITAQVNTYDTAATVAYILGLAPPACWIARPVLDAFEKK